MSTIQIAGDEEVGRMPQGSGGDEDTDFDVFPQRESQIEFDAEGTYEMVPLTSLESVSVEGDAEPDVFQPPKSAADEFPVVKAALKKERRAEKRPRVVRIDTEETYGDFVCERAVREIDRRLRELKDALEQHFAEHEHEEHPGYQHPAKKLREWDEILGAAEAVKQIKAAATPAEAEAAMPNIPVDLPPGAEGSIRCWRDGESVACSIRFLAADGTGRIATMATKPKAAEAEIAGWALRRGVDPIVVLGALPDMVEVGCAKGLVKEVAGAALDAQRRLDVCGMSVEEYPEPILLVAGATRGPVAPEVRALAAVQKRAQAGDRQAQRELGKLGRFGSTKVERLLGEASECVAAESRRAPSFYERYAQMGMVL